MNNKKLFIFVIIALFFSLVAINSSSSGFGGGNGTNSTNGTNFTANITGQPALSNAITFVAGTNVTLYQNSTNHSIMIDSLGGGGSSVNNGSILINESQVVNLTTDLNTKLNLTGGTMQITGNNRINLSNNGMVTGSYDAWYLNPDTYTFFTSNRYQDKTTGWQCLNNCNQTGATIIWKNNLFWYLTSPTSTNGVVSWYSEFTINNNSVIIDYLKGAGNAYVCVDTNGRLYRNTSPCI